MTEGEMTARARYFRVKPQVLRKVKILRFGKCACKYTHRGKSQHNEQSLDLDQDHARLLTFQTLKMELFHEKKITHCTKNYNFLLTT